MNTKEFSRLQQAPRQGVIRASQKCLAGPLKLYEFKAQGTR